MNDAWQSWLGSRFPGYLLPESAHAAVDVQQARAFLNALTGRPDDLELLRGASFLSRAIEALHRWVHGPVAQLVRRLPSRSLVEDRVWEGGFRGRLDVPGTLMLWTQGRKTSFRATQRQRDFGLPENLVLRATMRRLAREIERLRVGRVLPGGSWGPAAREVEGAIRHLEQRTALAQVPLVQPDAAHVAAARSARDPVHRGAGAWLVRMARDLDDDDPATIARVLADGALLPLDEPTRFEVAVVLRIADELQKVLTVAGGWTTQRTVLISGRRELFAFQHTDGTKVRLFYNQAVLPAGEADRGIAHYLARNGRMRPDATITVDRPGVPRNAMVVEVKMSEDQGYLADGFLEAIVYRWEYTEQLRSRPKAMLVASSTVPGSLRGTDDVAATCWGAPWGDWLAQFPDGALTSQA